MCQDISSKVLHLALLPQRRDHNACWASLEVAYYPAANTAPVLILSRATGYSPALNVARVVRSLQQVWDTLLAGKDALWNLRQSPVWESQIRLLELWGSAISPAVQN